MGIQDALADPVALTRALVDVESVSGNEAELAGEVEAALRRTAHLKVERFGNTVVATSQVGELRVHYKPDHSFSGRAEGPAGKYDIRGTWKLDGQNLCRNYSTTGADLPPGTPNPYCAPVTAHKVGDTWTVTSNGITRTITLKAGIQ